MKKVMDKFGAVLMYAVAAMLMVLVVLATVQVITRYFIAVQIIWIEEVSIYNVTWIAALGMPWMWLRQGHIRMDVLNFVLPKKIIRGMDYMINAVTMVAAVGVIRVGLRTIHVNTGYVMSVIKMDEGMRYWPVLTGGVLLLISAFMVLVQMIEEDRGKAK